MSAPHSDLLLSGALLRHGPGLEQVTRVALAIGGGRILALVPEEDVPAWAMRAARRIDLDGALVLPGLVDNHTHLGWAGEALWQVDWREVRDRATALERVRIAAGRIPSGLWLFSGGWPRDAPAEVELPSLAELDAATGDAPLFLSSDDGTLALANSHALRLWRLGPEHGGPQTGEGFERDANGRLTGRLRGAAARARQTAWAVPPPDRYRRRAELRAALAELARHGITEAHDIASFPDTGPTPLTFRERSFTDATLFEELAERDELTARISIRPVLDRWQEVAGLVSKESLRHGLLSCHGLKLLLDVALYSVDGAGGGYTYRYPGFGTTLDWMRGADRARLNVSIHAVGDLGVREALDLFEAVARSEPPWPRRPRLIHARRIAPEDIERIARLGVIVEAQPWDFVEAMPALLAQSDERFLATAYPFRSLLDAGARVTFGSDWRMPQMADQRDLDPLRAIYAAVTRTPPDGDGGTWQPDQGVSIAEAVAAYTSAGAWAGNAEQRRGAVQTGMDADLVVLSRDIIAGDAQSLLATKVLLTVVAGRVVYAAEG